MRLILAESGRDIYCGNLFLKSRTVEDLIELQKEIVSRESVNPADQILLTLNGIQIKPTANRPTALWQQINKAESGQFLWEPNLIIAHPDTLVLFNRRYIVVKRPSMASAVDDSNDDTDDEESSARPPWSLISIWLDEMPLEEHIKIEPLKIATNSINRTRRAITKIHRIANEVANYYLALTAALNNLLSHVCTADETVAKFNRIAQREFKKQATALKAIELDIQLIQRIPIHRRVLQSIVVSDSRAEIGNTQTACLMDYVATFQELTEMRHTLQQQFEELTLATAEQVNKMRIIGDRDNNVTSVGITSCKSIKQKVDELKRSSASRLFELTDEQWRILSETPFISTTERPANVNKNLLVLLRALCESVLSLKARKLSALKCKREGINVLFNGMKRISQIEQSVSQVYPRLASLEKKVKALRSELEKGQGIMIRRVITGYGMLLIDLWKQDMYDQAVSENAHLFNDLARQFGKGDQKYRRSFIENEIICLESPGLLFSAERVNDEKLALLPFKIEGSEKAPTLAQIAVANESKKETRKQPVILKEDIENLIVLIENFYKENLRMQETGKTPKDQISPVLWEKLERERSAKDTSPSNFTSSSSNIAALSAQPARSVSSAIKRVDNMRVAAPSPTLKLFSTPPFFQRQSSTKEMDSQSDKQQQLSRLIEELRFKQEQDRVKYEKDRASLLSELDVKEKRIEEMHTSYEYEIEALQIKMNEDREEYEKRLKDIVNDYNDKVELEQQKYERRMNTIFQRVQEKDEEIRQLMEQQRTLSQKSIDTIPSIHTAAAPNSASEECSNEHNNSVFISHEKYDKDLAGLQSKIQELEAQNNKAEDTIRQLQQEIKSYQSKLNKQNADTDLTESRLQQLFMAENTQKMMHAEARVENLQAEHEQVVKELEETHENEKRVLRIQFQTQLDEVEKKLQRRLKAQSLDFAKETETLRKENELLKKDRVSLQKQNTNYRQRVKELRCAQKEVFQLQQQSKNATVLAKQLLSVLEYDDEEEPIPLLDMLKKATNLVATLQYRDNETRNQVVETDTYDDYHHY